MSKPALGRGLGALLGGSPTPSLAPAAASVPTSVPASPAVTGDVVQRVPLASVRPGSFQPRKDFSDAGLQELADSIREQGIVQPLLVRRQGGSYELIAGERRWRAAQRVGLAEVPVIVREADDRSALELALIENLQRENLNPVEEAQGFAQLIDQFKLTQEEAALKVGKSRTAVANALRLLKLAPEIQAHVRDGRISVGHAKVILSLSHPEEQRLAADRVMRRALNVRQTEILVSQMQAPGTPPGAGEHKRGTRSAAGAHLERLRSQLHERLGTKVDLRYRDGKGTLQIHFFSDDDLERVLEILGVTPD